MGLDTRLAGFTYTGCGVYLLLDETGRPWAKVWEDETQAFCGYVGADGTLVTHYGNTWDWDRDWDGDESDADFLARHPDRFALEEALREAARNAAEPLGEHISTYRKHAVTQDRLFYIEAIPPERRGSLRGSIGPDDEGTY